MEHPQSLRRLALIAAAALASLAPAVGSAQMSIVNSVHNFASRGWGTNEVCIFCHTPHNAGAKQIVPLWNHGTTTAVFTTYASATLNATPGQPNGNSRACLSCHDGTVAIDTFGGRTGTNFAVGSRVLGSDLSNDHPVSFTYDAALATADGHIVSPASAAQVVPGIPLFNGELQCASCHQVHDNTHGMFLRAANAGSALCLRCHLK